MGKVLVVDSSATVRKMIKFVLDSHAIEVLEAADHREALAVMGRCGQGEGTMIFTDLDLPDHGGIELIRLVRSHPAYGQLPIVLMAQAEDRRIGEGRLAGATALLVKPLTSQQILSTVKRWSRKLETGQG